MSVFKKDKKKPDEAQTPSASIQNSPYTEARQEWNERYGGYIEQAKTWKTVAIVSLVSMVLAVFGLIYIGAQQKIVPYIVEVNKIGEPVKISRLEAVQRIDARLIKSMLAEFVINARSVSPDTAVNRQRLTRVYAFLRPSDPATQALNQYYKDGGSPNLRAQTETVTIEILSLLPLTKDTWQVEWTENVRDRNRGGVKSTKMKATVNMTFAVPQSDEQLLLNPMGLFWTDFSAAKELQ